MQPAVTVVPPPSLPNPPMSGIDAQFMEVHSNVLRLYFNQLQNASTVATNAAGSAQTLIWLGDLV